MHDTLYPSSAKPVPASDIAIDGWQLHELASIIELEWAAGPGAVNPGVVHDAVEAVIAALDCGRLRVAERRGVGQWTVNQWVKKAVLLSFRLSDNKLLRAGDLSFFDKV
ncbi:MAG TPA: hypothetical protein VFZ93_15440, partial [Albitalea sp.]